MTTSKESCIHDAEIHEAALNKPLIMNNIAKLDNGADASVGVPGDLVGLAQRSASLSTRMYNLANRCGHAPTHAQVEEVAGELANVSTVLYRLNEAMTAQPDRYTQAFKQDLDKNITELGLYLDEITDCAEELHKKDPLGNEHVVPWFFKKGRVTRLIKHLQLLKGQLSIMRLVLNEGSEFLVTDEEQREPRPLTEARVTIEAALAKNQNAIREVLEYENAIRTNSAVFQKKSNFNTEDNKDRKSRDIHQAGSCADPFIDGCRTTEIDDMVHLNRRFTKRVRDGIHIPILNIGNNPARLKSMWIKQAAADNSKLTALPEANSNTVLSSGQLGFDAIYPGAAHPPRGAAQSLNEGTAFESKPVNKKPETRWNLFKRHASKLNIGKQQARSPKQGSRNSERRMSGYHGNQGVYEKNESPSSATQAEDSMTKPSSTNAEIWQEIKAIYTYPFRLLAAGYQKHKAGRQVESRKEE